MANHLLVAPLPPAAPAPEVTGVRLTPIGRKDVDAVGRLYWEVYGAADGETTLDEAVADVVRALDGGYGRLVPEASLVAWASDDVVGSVLTVVEAPWPDVPRGAFIIDLFVADSHRRRGLGTALVLAAMAASPGEAVGLRVDDDAVGARDLYERLGFREVP